MIPATRRIQDRKTRNQCDDSIAMTPMIDVVFQMLIYFVLTFEVPDRMSQMSVWRPKGDDIDTVPRELPTQIGVRNGFYTLDNQQISLSYLEKYFNHLADLDPDQYLIVVAENQSHHHELVTLLDSLNKAGLENISLLSAD